MNGRLTNKVENNRLRLRNYGRLSFFIIKTILIILRTISFSLYVLIDITSLSSIVIRIGKQRSPISSIAFYEKRPSTFHGAQAYTIARRGGAYNDNLMDVHSCRSGHHGINEIDERLAELGVTGSAE